jgi:hypothetical protein
MGARTSWVIRASKGVSVTDWHATILHLLGLDYQRLVFDQNGLKEKLTSVFDARIVNEILA